MIKVPTEELEWLRDSLAADTIDDSEELLEWLGQYGIDLVNEVLEKRSAESKEGEASPNSAQ